MKNGELPSDPKKAYMMKQMSLRFILVDWVLYKRSLSQPLVKCLGPQQSNYVLREIHEGCCGNQLGSYFWPTMLIDSLTPVVSCNSCQCHAKLQHQPAALMNSIVAACPFDQWGIDIVGPFSIAPAQKKLFLVTIDYFWKWVEAEDLAKITESEVQKFLWKNIVCRFGVPRKLISDNGRKFQGSRIQAWCKEMKIQQYFTSVAYPQCNGQVESYRITLNIGTGETPSSLVYGNEAVLPAEIGEETSRVIFYDEQNDERRAADLDFLEEKREAATVRMEAYKRRIAQSYNKKVIQRSFQVGDLVWKKVQDVDVGELDPIWEGPFKVVEKLSSGAYYLEDLAGKKLKRPWNAYHLRKYYT
ncbi:uncharacterized protein [Primulina huaijiensis]|uniref:uncharacterized protein n=1 Tax=Primulina huaijiensis TaxID=1492673 RepID=UPI003CC70E92